MKSMPRREATPALEFLRRHEATAGLLPAAERLVKLQSDLLAAMPTALRATCEVSGFDDDTVQLRVSSASAAAKLRQTLPRLRSRLLDQGWKVSAIRVRVQPRLSVEYSRTWKSERGADMASAGVAAFAALDADLAASPLKLAVARLLDRRRAP